MDRDVIGSADYLKHVAVLGKRNIYTGVDQEDFQELKAKLTGKHGKRL
jgi:hypothetical protein